ncbi:hypothetical protein Patl1_11575 [Pistacia atlantica]|uniref:Uncharacterized protein n=1 Tax=Pistacia atlantica TaxID=434234 RepID=A0ACC1A4H6_9ROSI|nr:hypothetical protein Patl1_11575 [Pistacia atlantica]
MVPPNLSLPFENKHNLERHFNRKNPSCILPQNLCSFLYLLLQLIHPHLLQMRFYLLQPTSLLTKLKPNIFSFNVLIVGYAKVSRLNIVINCLIKFPSGTWSPITRLFRVM